MADASADQIFNVLRALNEATNNIGKLLTDGVTITTLPGSDYPAGATPIVGSATTTSNTSLVGTLAAASGKTTYIAGFDMTASGSTAPDTRTLVIAGVGTTLNYIFGFTTGNPAISTPMSMRFPRPIPASATNTAITVTMPLMPVGVDNAALTVYGYQI